MHSDLELSTVSRSYLFINFLPLRCAILLLSGIERSSQMFKQTKWGKVLGAIEYGILGQV